MPARYAAVDSAVLLGERATVRVGYAARESVQCQVGELDCGSTIRPYVACCPEDTECVSLSLNARCCIPDKDCTSQLVDKPQCANPEHDMYDFDGYFCCEQDRKGYGNTDTEGDGCGTQDYVLKKYEKWLTIVVSGKAISTSTSKTTGAPSATNPGNTVSHTTVTNSSNTSSTGTADPTTTGPSASQTPTVGGSPTTTAPSAGAPSSTDNAAAKTSNTGAIAGGVVGGIAALALIAALLWFLRRRKARSYASTTPQSPLGAYHAVEGQGPEKDVPLGAIAKSADQAEGAGGVSELPGKEGADPAAAELYGQEGKRVAEMYSPGAAPAEMYSPSVTTTAELHGVERGPGELPAWDGRGVPAQLKVGDGKGGPVELP